VEASRALQPAATPEAQPRAVEPAPEQVFEQLYRRHAAEIYRYALGLLGNTADAEDVAQTTFLNAYRAFQSGQQPLHARNWLITIAHNVCRMRWRQAGHRPREVALEDAPEPAAPEYERPDLDGVLRALGRLSFNQRAALVMRELEGRSYREIAEVLGISTGAVEALLFRARRRLRVERRALGVLTTVPLPAKLGSALGLGSGGTATATAGGTALGADLLLKAATVIAIGAVTGGTAAKHFVGHHRAPSAAAAAAVAPSVHVAATTSKAKQRTTRANRAKLRARTRAGTAHTSSAGTTATVGGTGLLGQPALPAGVPAPPPLQVPQLPVEPPALPDLNLPPVPPLPPLPPPPLVPPLPPPPQLP
jgi:RNA polymerase sigma factor (sigma-70 family)